MGGSLAGAICPNCHASDIKRIPMPIAAEHVAYMRCNRCSHIWTVNTETGEKIADVTQGRGQT
jgi:Zn ribbon nucleic-acid-binding protein